MVLSLERPMRDLRVSERKRAFAASRALGFLDAREGAILADRAHVRDGLGFV